MGSGGPANNLVYIVLDSCRYDSFARAETPNMARLGPLARRYSFASWTAPSHFSLLMGQVPHHSPRGVYAWEVFRTQFTQWVVRLGLPDMSFQTFVPDLCLAAVLRKHAYRTIARVSLPALNPSAGLARGFDDYRLMAHYSSLADILPELVFPADERRFYFLNLGETHYPYMLTDEMLPKLPGLHGVASRMDKILARSGETPGDAPVFFSQETMRHFHDQQIRCVSYVDGLVGDLMAQAPPNTYFLITGDHGELFGEDNYFGHGPIMHEKCFEVPLIEGLRP